MNLKLGSLPLPDPGVGRGLLDLSPVLPPEGPLGRARLEVDHQRPPPDGQALLRPDARLRPPLCRKLDVPEPLFSRNVPRGRQRERFARAKRKFDGDIAAGFGGSGWDGALLACMVGTPLSGYGCF